MTEYYLRGYLRGVAC